MKTEFCEENVPIRCGALTLSGRLGYPEKSNPDYAVLICPPHPNFAGNMENNVVEALAREFSPHAFTLRFDFRGVGESGFHLPAESVFDYWDEVETSKNYEAPLADASAAAAALIGCAGKLPLAIVGYSFGAIIGLQTGLALGGVSALAGVAPPLRMYEFDFLAACPVPCLLVSGETDFVDSPDEAKRLAPFWGSGVQRVLLPGEDHFFRETEAELCARVRVFIEGSLIK